MLESKKQNKIFDLKSDISSILIGISFLLCLIFGVFMSIKYYQFTEIQYKFWGIFFASVCIFFLSKIFNKPIKLYQFFLILFVLIFYLISWLLVPYLFRFGTFLFSSFCFLYTGTIFLNSRFRILKVIFFIAYLISSFNLLTILFYLSEGSIITRELINTLFISNAKESKEYLYGKVSVFHFIVLLLFLFLSLLLFLKKSNKINKTQVNFSLLLLFSLSFLLSSFSGPLGGLLVEFVHYKKYQKILKDMVAAKKDGLTNTSFSVETNINTAKKVVVIIGESLNRENMSLYGFTKNTTPFLNSLYKKSSLGKLFLFNNVISPEVTTVLSLKKVLTNVNNDNGIKFEESVSLVDLFKKANYQVLWLSNQAPLRDYDTPVAYIASSADSVYYTSDRNDKRNLNHSFKNHYDGDLINVFDSYISKNKFEGKQIYFIHLMGSHFNYEDRYPTKFNVFKEGEITEQKYLNSLLYNDWVVSQIIKISEKNNTDVICYFSDHGDDITYNHNPENYRKSMSTIPFLVYLSNNYMKSQTLLVNDLLKNKYTPGMTDNFFNDLQRISGFRSSLYVSERSFISEDYIQLKRKVIDNKVPFDK